MTTALIIGSGAAAAGAAIALSQHRNLDITVIDIGLQLERERQQLVDGLASADPCDWDNEMVQNVSRQPVASKPRGVPEKRVFGSDYPFRDAGQLRGLTAATGAATSLISSAYGGFSNVWGSQFMPFTASTFDNWPVSATTMRRHYEAILNQIPFAGEEDDLASTFPLMHQPVPLPQMSTRSSWVLEAYKKNRRVLNDRGITVGKARLALDAEKCLLCGMCMTGCPYRLIYSAAQTFDELGSTKRVKLHRGLLALRVMEDAEKAVVVAKELATGLTQRFEADRVYIACGAMGTTRLVANSLGLFDTDLHMLESQQFILPMISLHATEDPRHKPGFTLNQFNMIVAPDGSPVDLAQLHFYTFNPAFVDGLPSVLRMRAAGRLQSQLLRRLTVAFGYLPSWRSPQLRVRVGSPSNGASLADVHISSESSPADRSRMLRSLLLRLMWSSRLLDLYPLVPMLRLSAGGKSYHWGGSFPHTSDRSTALGSDRLGRVGPWERIHLIDASVFPSIPAMTFGLTIMANAHRIASETLEFLS